LPVRAAAVLLLGSAFALSACASWLDQVDVRVNAADGFEPASIKTYAWVDPPLPEGERPGMNRRTARLVRAFTRQELASKGYEEKPLEQADAWVSYHAVVAGPARDDSYAAERRAAWPGSWEAALDYREGTLLIGLLEPGSENVLWLGAADGYTRNDPAMVQVVVERLVKAIFAKLPDAASP
jgi:hypothetical protein